MKHTETIRGVPDICIDLAMEKIMDAMSDEVAERLKTDIGFFPGPEESAARDEQQRRLAETDR